MNKTSANFQQQACQLIARWRAAQGAMASIVMAVICYKRLTPVRSI